jgi:hypothetical protein
LASPRCWIWRLAQVCGPLRGRFDHRRVSFNQETWKSAFVLAIVMEEEILRDRKLLALGFWGRASSKRGPSEAAVRPTWKVRRLAPHGPALRKPRPLPIASAMSQKPPLHLEKKLLPIEEKRRDKTDQDKAERIE